MKTKTRAVERTRSGFTLPELIVTVVLFVLVSAMLIPAMSHVRHMARVEQSNEHLRDLHQGIASPRRGDHQPLVNISPSDRYNFSLHRHLIRAGSMISPLDTDKALATKDASGRYAVTTANFSYAMLDITPRAKYPDARYRRGEWKGETAFSTPSSQAAMLVDRSLAIVPPGDSLETTSLHVTTTTTDSLDWRGGVCWKDNHVTFELDGIMTTQYLSPLESVLMMWLIP